MDLNIQALLYSGAWHHLKGRATEQARVGDGKLLKCIEETEEYISQKYDEVFPPEE